MSRFSVRRFTALIVAIAALVVGSLVLGLGSIPGEAQQAQTCTGDMMLAADGTCISKAVDDNVTTGTSCTVGVLSADGQSCIVPRLDAPASPTPAAAAPAAPAGAVAAPVPNFTG